MPRADILKTLRNDFVAHLKDEDNQFKELHSKLDAIKTSHTSTERSITVLEKDMQSVKGDVAGIIGMKINGFDGLIPLLRSLHGQTTEIVELTSDLRKDRDFRKARDAWYQTHTVTKFLVKNRYGNIFFGLLIAYVLLSVLYAMGLPTNPNVIAWALIKGRLNI